LAAVSDAAASPHSCFACPGDTWRVTAFVSAHKKLSTAVDNFCGAPVLWHWALPSNHNASSGLCRHSRWRAELAAGLLRRQP
jgi:hypothetical protein